MSKDHTYKVIELVGSSPESMEQAIKNAIDRAGESLEGLDWFEVKEIRGNIQQGRIAWYQVKLGVGFRVMEVADLHRG
ncbi:MAG: dodecin [Dehalococcoidia bacterium]